MRGREFIKTHPKLNITYEIFHSIKYYFKSINRNKPLRSCLKFVTIK